MSQRDNAITEIGKWVAVLGVAAAVVLWGMHSLFGGADQAEPDARVQASVDERIAPIGTVVSSEAEQVAAEGDEGGGELSGAEVFDNTCAACHSTGAAGAPTLEADAWQPRLDERGMDGLLQNAIDGFNGMPPRGGNADLSDDDVENAIRYILEESGVSS